MNHTVIKPLPTALLTALLSLFVTVCLFSGCEPHYYSDESSSEAPEEESVSDPTPPFVFGENGFYDTGNDTEYLLLTEYADYVLAKEKGEMFCEGPEHTYYRIPGEDESYLLCDELLRVYKNSALPFADPWQTADWETLHPGLILVQDEEN